MPSSSRHLGQLVGDDLMAALRSYARDRAVDGNAAAEFELSLLHFQKLATLGQMAADVARDFGNLMTAVLGYSEMLLAAAEKDELPEHEHLIELRRAAEQASTLTERLLNYTRHATDEAAPLDLGRLVGRLAAMLGRLLGSGGGLVVTSDPATATVLADAGQIEQLIVNLVLNARDAIAASGRVEVAVDPVRLTAPLVHVLGTAPPGDYVRLRVRDNGRGMDPETVSQLFQPFFTTKCENTGLGLTIVARIARNTNAALVLDSAVGRGTTVDLFFPGLEAGNAAGRNNNPPAL